QPGEAEHGPPVVDGVAPGLTVGAHDVGVDDDAALADEVASLPQALDHEPGAVVVDLDVARPTLGGDPGEQGALVGDDPGAHLLGAEALGEIGGGGFFGPTPERREREQADGRTTHGLPGTRRATID